jgi:hypothetical protein
MATTALARVKRDAVTIIPETERNQLVRWQAKMVKTTEELEKKVAGLWGPETARREVLTSDLWLANKRRDWLVNRVNYSQYYHELSFEPLSWRNEEGWPSLVVFDTGSPTASFEATESNGWIAEPSDLPDVFRLPYQDVLNKLQITARRKRNRQILTFTLDGRIPDEAKEKANSARKLGLDIYMIAEPTHIVLREEPIPVPMMVDPLIVGLDKTNQLWLIADFDVTPVEVSMFLNRPR